MDRLVTQKELAECLRITARQIRNLKQDGLFQGAMEGKKYILPKCIQEYIDFKVKAETGKGTALVKERVQAEHEEIKRQISVLKLSRLRREMHYASDVEDYLSDMLVRFRERLLEQPQKIAMKVTGQQDANYVIAELEKGFNEALAELAEYDPDAIDKVTMGELYEDEEEDEP